MRTLPARALARWSAGALDAPLTGPADVLVATAEDDAVLLGAFQRSGEHLTSTASAASAAGAPGGATALPVLRRGSGGVALRAGPGLVHVLVRLAHPAALVADADPPRLVNRLVRPLLRALVALGVPATYGGRDFVAVRRAPVAWVGLAHDGRTERATFEAVVGVSVTPWLAAPRSHDGRVAESLAGLAANASAASAASADVARVAAGIEAAYLAAFGEGLTRAPESARGDDADDEADADAARPEARTAPATWPAALAFPFGVVGIDAGAPGGPVWLGGELAGSRDAVAALEDALARGDEPAAVAVVSAPRRHLVGVRPDDVRALVSALRTRLGAST